MRFAKRSAAAMTACLALAACSEPLDFDLRGNLGAFSTADAARTATASRPAPDARGIISYPTYQVAVARRGDTVTSLAQRIGSDADALARFNGVDKDVPLRDGEILALPSRVTEPAPGTPGSIDLTTLAGNAIDDAPSTPRVTTAALEPAQPSQADAQGEPIRHKVSRGETAYTIARLYRVPVRALGEWNGLSSDFAIREGQYLLIPVANAEPPRRTASAQPVTEPGQGSPTPTPPSATTPLPDEDVASASSVPPAPTVDVGTPTRASTARMAMPVQGSIIRDYAKGRNDGIDIAADPGAPVRAADDGTVAAITSDADQVPIVVVRHADNILTVYANVDGISVEKGDTVTRGQQIARLRGGDDAYVHFEVREGFDSVDPNPYLN
ncbi:peptidoglycan DD-metalloendopeptidase family protein [Aestuariivita sp.]|jgi:murein DD-endopeptidase MepM/ murein hydrolase activator NlpD|uniref:peptidoglycan DD-metalloendopeptidase family protein n=1 Tax=Aestuariivita sp. TaxID=1872407 RepID=UPI00216CEE26|nr:peptidoglycan DD-metalloendopeptidase family protein [Aestuariivita sp.]MCE8008796.1 peptidoglycan DD-metalloendopeptidase family protein [Aestuariivita sp.]